MGVLAPVLAVDGGHSAFDDYWYQPRSFNVGGPVDPASAMTIPQFYAAVTYVSEDIGKVPLNVYEDRGPRGTEPAADHELQELLHNQPNSRQSAIEWREMETAFAMLRGLGVSEILTGPSASFPGRPTAAGRIRELVPLHPDLVHQESTRDGRRYRYRDPRLGKERTLLDDEVLVIRGRQSRSVLDFASRNLGTMIATEKMAGFLFSRGARHQGVIKAKGKLADPVRVALRNALDEYAIDGPRAGRPLLLEDGMEWQQITMTAKDAQMLEMKHASVEDVCAWIRVPPHKVFNLTRSTNNNIESQGVDYVVDCLLAWAIRWEQAIWRDAIVDKRFFVKHVLDGLLRGDFEARSKAYALAIMWGWMTRNEVRAKEDLNPLAGLDDPLTPVNMTTDPDGQPAPTTGTQAQLPANAASLAETLTEPVTRGLLSLYASDAASRIVRREMAAMSKLADRTAGDHPAWVAGVSAYYADHAEQIARDLHIPEHEARRHVAEQVAMLHAHGLAAMDDWLTDRSAYLAETAIAGAGPVDVHRPSPVSLTVLPAPVHIADGAIRVEAPPAADVHVTAPVQVDVAPAEVTVSVAPVIAMPARRTTKDVERDSRGAIVKVTETEASVDG